ncbi:VOC family protein [Agrobacterium salinitolerans]|uniref:VOC family protein n=1 Tax=Agrobacterium salinitolerans TaxID=1183413 RepID=UPI001573EB1E|nr:VOC family protein [Agrobacterium salinitolerans]NTA40333.1 VOC family protein [Agrobacterium salinitolerans]
MTEDTSIQLSLFVEHGREREAANFYEAAFGAQEEESYTIDGVLAGVAMRFGGLPVTVAGSNPNREKMPSYGGPFYPKQAGAVSTIFQVAVGDIDAAFSRAIAAGATIRDETQTDTLGPRIASIFDPFGHIWAIVQQKAATASLTA